MLENEDPLLNFSEKFFSSERFKLGEILEIQLLKKILTKKIFGWISMTAQ